MVRVEPFRAGFQPVVVLKTPSCQVELFHFVACFEKVEPSFFDNRLAQISLQPKRVSGQIHRKCRAHYAHFAHFYLPTVLAFGRIFRHSVAHCNAEHGIFQMSHVHFQCLCGQVNAMGSQVKPSDVAFYACFMNEVGRVESHVFNGQLVNLDLLMQQRPQLNIGNELSNISHRVSHLREGVVRLNDFNALYAQIQGEFKVDMRNGNLHSRFIGGV